MTPNTSESAATQDAQIAKLVQTIHAAERELLTLTGGREGALAETQASILNSLPAQIAVLDGEGVIVVVNEAWRSFASANVLQSTDFLVGQNYIGVCEDAHGDCADESQAVAQGIRQVLSGADKFFALEYPCHSPTEQRWFRLMVTPLSDRPGTGAVVMHVNVTERRLAEEVLREKEGEQRRLAEMLAMETQRLHESQAVANVGSWETDLTTFDVRWSDETYRIFEVSPDALPPTHQKFLEMVHPDDRARVDAAFANSAGRSEAFAIEHRICLPDGRIKVVEERWQAFRDETGKPTRAVGTCQDITARATSEAERDRMFNLSLDLLSVASFEGRLEQVNPAWTRCLGWSAEELTSSQWTDFVHPDDHESTRAAGGVMVQGDRIQEFENRYRCKDGTYRWLS